jgi:hypothetical protein
MLAPAEGGDAGTEAGTGEEGREEGMEGTEGTEGKDECRTAICCFRAHCTSNCLEAWSYNAANVRTRQSK